MSYIKSILLVTFLLFINLKSKGQNWDSLGAGATDVRVLYADTVSNLLYIGGSFNNGGGIGAWGIASWNGTNWDTVGRGIDNYPPLGSNPGSPLAMCRYNSELYVAGGFYQAGTANSPVIAKWNGLTWSAVPSGFNGVIVGMMEYGTDLYVCGEFDSIAGILANGLAKWNGTSWSNVNSIPNYDAPISGNNQIYCMAEFQGNLYVGGNFTGTSGYSRIVYWDGTQWNPLANGGILGATAGVNSMAVYQNELYVAGLFFKADGNIGNQIQKWNGTSWSEVGGGMGGNSYPQIWNLKVIDSALYAVGVFTTAGGVPASRIAKWDGNQWCGFGDVLSNGVITTIETYNNSIYIGGGFVTINADTINGIAKWIGGNYIDTCGTLTSINELGDNTEAMSVFPNPTLSQITIEFEISEIKNASVILKNILGQPLKIINDKELIKGKNKIAIDLSEFPSGLYFVQFQDENKIITRKIIKN